MFMGALSAMAGKVGELVSEAADKGKESADLKVEAYLIPQREFTALSTRLMILRALVYILAEDRVVRSRSAPSPAQFRKQLAELDRMGIPPIGSDI